MEAQKKATLITWLIGIGSFILGCGAGFGGKCLYDHFKADKCCEETETTDGE